MAMRAFLRAGSSFARLKAAVPRRAAAEEINDRRVIREVWCMDIFLQQFGLECGGPRRFGSLFFCCSKQSEARSGVDQRKKFKAAGTAALQNLPDEGEVIPSSGRSPRTGSRCRADRRTPRDDTEH